MIYNKRVKIIYEKKVPDYLEEKTVKSKTALIPCNISGLSMDEQIGLFGKHNHTAFKVYFQGIHKGFSKIEYEGLERSVYLIKWHRNSTVVILT